MLGALIEAVGVPAAILRRDRRRTLVVERANAMLAAVLGCDHAALPGEAAEVLLPRLALATLEATLPETPIDTRLGPLALPYRAVVRALSPRARGVRRLLVTFVPGADSLDLGEASQLGLGREEIGALALEVLDMQSEMLSRWRPDGTIVYCNEAFARQCGRALNELVGANLHDLTPPHEMAQILRNVAPLTPAAPGGRLRPPHPGRPRRRALAGWIDRAFFDEQGRVTSYLSVGRDITARKLAERQLAESERRLTLALEAGRQGVWELRFDTGAITVDRALEELLRLPSGGYALDLERSAGTYHPDDRGRVREAVAAVMRGESDAYRVEARRLTGDGDWVWVLNFGRVADRDAAGRPLRMVGTTIDIDQRKRAELHLLASEQRLRLALGAGSLASGSATSPPTSSTTTRSAVPVSAGTQTGAALALAEVIELVHPRDRARFRGLFARWRRGAAAPARVEYRMRRRDGGYVWLEEHAQVAERGPDGRVLQLVGVSADITARKEAELQLAHLALHDPLTGLPNRRGLGEALDQAVARSQRTGLPLAVLALDLDGFKAINDRHGHPAGDAALIEVARRLRQTIRRSDLVARLGGDEFAVLAGELNGPAPVVRLARRLGAALRAPIALPGAVALIDVSIGVAFFPGDGDTPAELLVRADLALYAAKREHAGCRFSADLPVAAV